VTRVKRLQSRFTSGDGTFGPETEALSAACSAPR